MGLPYFSRGGSTALSFHLRTPQPGVAVPPNLLKPRTLREECSNSLTPFWTEPQQALRRSVHKNPKLLRVKELDPRVCVIDALSEASALIPVPVFADRCPVPARSAS